MSDQSDELRNPYATPESTQSLGDVEAQRVYGGIRRLPYFAFSVLSAIVFQAIAFALGFSEEADPSTENAGLFLIVLGIFLAVTLWLVASRSINSGYSPWWCLGIFIPILNIIVGIRCLACPEGYAQHKTLDTAGKVIGIVFLAAMVLAFAGVFLVSGA